MLLLPQVPGEPGRFPAPYTGKVIAKNPALHPGDPRVLRAVDRPSLHHLRNVLVFPVVGPRPESHKSAGGDLDGDEFLIIWSSRLTGCSAREPSNDYTVQDREQQETVAGDLTAAMNEEARTTERIQYFVDFLSRDVLGKIANAWEARADKDGADSEMCLELARQHSLAVDAAKNGNMPTLDPTHFLPSVPEFQREIAGTCTVDRTSDGIVSRLWRRARADVEGLREPASTQAFRSVQYHEAGFECFLPRACELRDEYNAQLATLFYEWRGRTSTRPG